MDTSLAVKNMRRQSWTIMLQNQAASGLSIREWCKQNDISLKCFYYRRRQVQAMLLDSDPSPSFAELVIPETDAAVPEMNRTDPGQSGFMPQLTLTAGDVLISIDQNTPEELIRKVLKVVRNA